MADTAMTGADIESIVDRKLESFKTELALELAPMKLQLQAHERQMAEIRTSNAATATGIARIEGSTETFLRQQEQHHKDEQGWKDREAKKIDELIEKFNQHLGQQEGQAGVIAMQEQSADRRWAHIREWSKVIIGCFSLAGLAKFAKDAWHHFHR